MILLLPYLYILIRIYAGLVRIKSFKPQSTPDISVSVIVACRNEEKNITSLLSGIASQDYNPDKLELIIIDDNSTDSTFNIASDYGGIRNLKVIKNPGTGKKIAIKSGIGVGSGELVVTTDADCRPGKNWLKTIVSYYSENKPDMIIGPVALKGDRGFFQRFQELEFLSLQGVTAGTAAIGDPVMCNGANLAYTKEAYKNHSLDLHEDKVSGDDIFLLHNLKENKSSKIIWLESTDALVTTCTSETWSSFISQRARWISKAGSYSDSLTVLLAFVTFVTILMLTALLVAGIFYPVFLLVFLVAFGLKSIPDYLILRNTTSRYGRKKLMRWFIPSQFLYTYYILRVVSKAVYSGNRW
ncbi:MAG: glycosyltransferase [Bacteroidales bacterium]|nr:glycosyltransferase [Bacteroidales bacterium]